VLLRAHRFLAYWPAPATYDVHYVASQFAFAWSDPYELQRQTQGFHAHPSPSQCLHPLPVFVHQGSAYSGQDRRKSQQFVKDNWFVHVLRYTSYVTPMLTLVTHRPVLEIPTGRSAEGLGSQGCGCLIRTSKEVPRLEVQTRKRSDQSQGWNQETNAQERSRRR
jgi:hypothetical protein